MSCEELSWNHCTCQQHTDRKQMGLLKEQFAEKKKGTSAVLLQSGVKNEWWADSMECYTCLRNVTDLLSDGKTPFERRFGQPFKGPIIPFVSLVEYYLFFFLRKTSQDSFNLERKSYLDCSLATLCMRREFGRVTYWLQTLRSWRRWTHRKSTQKRLNANEVIFPKDKWRIYFSIRRWTNQTPLEEIKTWKHPPWYGNTLFEEKVALIFLENQNGLFHNLKTRFWMQVKRWMTIWSMSGNFISPPSRWT